MGWGARLPTPTPYVSRETTNHCKTQNEHIQLKSD